MLVNGSTMLNSPVLSLHIGGPIGITTSAVIDPSDLSVIAYTVNGAVIRNNSENGDILDVADIREVSDQGLIIDSDDVLVNREDIIHLDEIMKLNFDLIGLKVVTKSGKKIGKVVNYTIDTTTFSVYQLIVQRPIGFSSILDPQLTINRSQIVEIDDYKVTIKHDKEEVKVPEAPKEIEELEEPAPRTYTNPFRKPNYAPSEEEISDNASDMSE